MIIQESNYLQDKLILNDIQLIMELKNPCRKTELQGKEINLPSFLENVLTFFFNWYKTRTKIQ